MVDLDKPLLSAVVPLYNEADGLATFHRSLLEQIQTAVKDAYEIIYVDDGSSDDTVEIVRKWHTKNNKIKLIRLSRNFGKENALAAGIAAASGDAVLTIDGDGQHPVELIPNFVKAWQGGSKVVVGVRSKNRGEGWLKRSGSYFFYRLFNRLSGERLIPGSTDFRLIDRAVADAFLRLQESDRITRGLIDWLGFKRELIYFEAKPRIGSQAPYSPAKLFGLAANSFVSLTPVPLYLFGYLGIIITSGATLLGGAVFIEQILLGDPLAWNFTGTAMIGILLLFLVGLVLLSQGMLSLYISHIHSQTKRRPLYIIDYEGSVGVRKV